ncbi:MAP3K epsilon protein kinase 1-like isoform X3 [Asparagus officinalis]|nr:MAP3K epsilon protein kinase 1-like isoform X3 [Asparagus officinalis]
MAPEVIEMSGVCAASDIWSVGCTVIELLTCVPPYYDLQPMPALFRIVQDVHPPIPDGLSADITDFLRQCFKKDAMQRPDAKTLLLHSWIQNSRRVLQSSLRQPGGSVRNIDEDPTTADDTSTMEDHHGIESPSEEKTKSGDPKVEREESGKEHLATEFAERDGSDGGHNAKCDVDQDVCVEAVDSLRDEVFFARDPTLVFHEKPYISSSNREEEPSSHEMVSSGAVNSPRCGREIVSHIEKDGEGSSSHDQSSLFSFKPGIQKNGLEKVASSVMAGGDELSRFSDKPGDASLEDLFSPLDKVPRGQGAEPSTSDSEQRTILHYDGGKSVLAEELKARMTRAHMENEAGQRNGEMFLEMMMDAINEKVIDGSVFDENLHSDSIFQLQSVEFSKLVGLLKPEESEDVILSACHKLNGFFIHRPEQKHVFMSQHGLLPLMELLDVPKNRVICAVLQIINQIVRDNVAFQENACLVGLVPVIMNFAVLDRSREVRMQAACFLQQLCQSSTQTLQMFIACRGIPVLVGFLEADYAKHRELVHLAIDGMWQVFKLQHSTPRNDFCRIAAKNGILLRLVNTLHSLNEATRLASVPGGSGALPQNGSSPKPRSGPLGPLPHAMQFESPLSSSGQLDSSKVRLEHHLSGVALESLHTSQRPEVIQLDSKQLSGDMEKVPAGHGKLEALLSSKFYDNTNENGGSWATRISASAASKKNEYTGSWKPDSSRSEVELLRQQRVSNSATRNSTDKPPKHFDISSNGHSGITNHLPSQQDQIRPLLSLLDKEPPSRHVSGQLDYVRNLSGLERHETILPLLHASTERKTNGELDFLMAEFAEVSRHGREIGGLDSNTKLSRKPSKKITGPISSATSNEGASTSGVASLTASGVLSGSGVLNARSGSTTSSGLLSQMVSSVSADVAREYLEKVADLLLVFAQADTIVKSYMCSQSLLGRLFQMFNRIEPPILLKILKCINHLSTDPNCLENLQRADAIKHLIPNLELHDGALVSQIHNEVLNALFNLCKINKRRQEQAAENGIIPHLMNFIMSDSPLKQYALPLLCDMAHASRNSREQLRAHGGLDVYLNLLEDEAWAGTALDSLAVCLAHDNDHRKVEQALLKKEAIQKLVKFFQCCPEQYFVNILEPFLKIITKSSRINTAMAVNGLTTLLIARLDHQDAIARLNLLKLIRAVYEHHPRPKQLIVENDLPHKLQNLIEERRDGQRSGGQVLVKQMATALLKALHINTVL